MHMGRKLCPLWEKLNLCPTLLTNWFPPRNAGAQGSKGRLELSRGPARPQDGDVPGGEGAPQPAPPAGGSPTPAGIPSPRRGCRGVSVAEGSAPRPSSTSALPTAAAASLSPCPPRPTPLAAAPRHPPPRRDAAGGQQAGPRCRCRYRRGRHRAAHLASRRPSWRPAPAARSPPPSRQPLRRGGSAARAWAGLAARSPPCPPRAPPPSGAIGALGPVRSLSAGFGRCPLGCLRSGRRSGIRERSERTRHSSAFLAPASAAFGRDRKRLERTRDSSTLRAGPLGDSALFGRARVPPPDLSGIASGRSAADSAGLGCVLPRDWPAAGNRGPRSSGAIARLRTRPEKTRDTSGTIGSRSEPLDRARGTRSEALGRARRRSAARRGALE